MRFIALLFLLATPLLSGCTGMVIGAAATVGVAAMEERPISVVASDSTISTKASFKIFEKDDALSTKVSVEVYDGRVLLTGAVDTEQQRADAVSVIWKVEGVKDVYNEIQITKNGFMDVAKDSLATSNLTTKMTFDGDIYAINYSIETVNGILYLIGLAQSQEELDRVLNHARSISYVRDVIPHVMIKKAAS